MFYQRTLQGTSANQKRHYLKSYNNIIYGMNYHSDIQLYFIEYCMRGDPLSALKGNNSCKMYNFRIKVGNMQMFYCE